MDWGPAYDFLKFILLAAIIAALVGGCVIGSVVTKGCG